jgi:hypothetical protein
MKRRWLFTPDTKDDRCHRASLRDTVDATICIAESTVDTRHRQAVGWSDASLATLASHLTHPVALVSRRGLCSFGAAKNLRWHELASSVFNNPTVSQAEMGSASGVRWKRRRRSGHPGGRVVLTFAVAPKCLTALAIAESSRRCPRNEWTDLTRDPSPIMCANRTTSSSAIARVWMGSGATPVAHR